MNSLIAFILLLCLAGQGYGQEDDEVTEEPQSYRTGKMNQFAGFASPRPLPANAQYMYASVWAAWSAWSFCSNNAHVRVRACNTVRGFYCLGPNKEYKECETKRPSKGSRQPSDYDVVDPWESDRKEAMRQLYPDYEPEEPKQRRKSPTASSRRLIRPPETPENEVEDDEELPTKPRGKLPIPPPLKHRQSTEERVDDDEETDDGIIHAPGARPSKVFGPRIASSIDPVPISQKSKHIDRSTSNTPPGDPSEEEEDTDADIPSPITLLKPLKNKKLKPIPIANIFHARSPSPNGFQTLEDIIGSSKEADRETEELLTNPENITDPKSLELESTTDDVEDYNEEEEDVERDDKRVRNPSPSKVLTSEESESVSRLKSDSKDAIDLAKEMRSQSSMEQSGSISDEMSLRESEGDLKESNEENREPKEAKKDNISTPWPTLIVNVPDPETTTAAMITKIRESFIDEVETSAEVEEPHSPLRYPLKRRGKQTHRETSIPKTSRKGSRKDSTKSSDDTRIEVKKPKEDREPKEDRKDIISTPWPTLIVNEADFETTTPAMKSKIRESYVEQVETSAEVEEPPSRLRLPSKRQGKHTHRETSISNSSRKDLTKSSDETRKDVEKSVTSEKSVPTIDKERLMPLSSLLEEGLEIPEAAKRTTMNPRAMLKHILPSSFRSFIRDGEVKGRRALTSNSKPPKSQNGRDISIEIKNRKAESRKRAEGWVGHEFQQSGELVHPDIRDQSPEEVLEQVLADEETEKALSKLLDQLDSRGRSGKGKIDADVTSKQNEPVVHSGELFHIRVKQRHDSGGVTTTEDDTKRRNKGVSRKAFGETILSPSDVPDDSFSISEEPTHISTQFSLAAEKPVEHESKSKVEESNSSEIDRLREAVKAMEMKLNSLTDKQPSASERAMNLNLVPQGPSMASHIAEKPTVIDSSGMRIMAGRVTSTAEWSDWSTWGQCFCEKELRTRSCMYDQPYMTKGCSGKSYESRPCEGGTPCPTTRAPQTTPQRRGNQPRSYTLVPNKGPRSGYAFKPSRISSAVKKFRGQTIVMEPEDD